MSEKCLHNCSMVFEEYDLYISSYTRRFLHWFKSHLVHFYFLHLKYKNQNHNGYVHKNAYKKTSGVATKVKCFEKKNVLGIEQRILTILHSIPLPHNH